MLQHPSEGYSTFISTEPEGRRPEGVVLINVLYPERGCYNEFMSCLSQTTHAQKAHVHSFCLLITSRADIKHQRDLSIPRDV